MRLINVKTYEIKQFFEHQVPQYAILSHTWGEEEVTLQDFKDLPRAREMKGFAKIEHTCQQAIRDGWDWAWVDTCCIDKTSLTELSEAIISMYKWYEGSKICYAYLDDIQKGGDKKAGPPSRVGHPSTSSLSWSTARWFTRGWTLQELIAPFEVIFFDRHWRCLGTKKALKHELSATTRIPADLLDFTLSIDSISVAARMSWAAGRRTTLEEDEAYCLQGIFRVAMPILYGEGSAAFKRLEERILLTHHDNSLFLGNVRGMSCHDASWVGVQDLCGFLAESVSNFADSPSLPPRYPFREPPPISAYDQPRLMNRGLRISLMVEEVKASEKSKTRLWKRGVKDIFGSPKASANAINARLVQRVAAALDHMDLNGVKVERDRVRGYPRLFRAALGCRGFDTPGAAGKEVVVYLLCTSLQNGKPDGGDFCRLPAVFDLVDRTYIASRFKRTLCYIRDPGMRRERLHPEFAPVAQLMPGVSALYSAITGPDPRDHSHGNLGGPSQGRIYPFILSKSPKGLPDLVVVVGVKRFDIFCRAIVSKPGSKSKSVRDVCDEFIKLEAAGSLGWQKVSRFDGPILQTKCALKEGEGIELGFMLSAKGGRIENLIVSRARGS